MKRSLSILMMLLLALVLLLSAPLASAEGEGEGEDETASDEWLYAEDAESDGATDENGDEVYEDFEFEDDEEFTGVEDDEAAVDSLDESDQDDLMAAMQVYSWFVLEPLDIDETQPDESGTMWRVLDERFNTKEQMLDMLRFYFSDDIVSELWDSNINPYKEINGFLYTAGEGRTMDDRIAETEIEVTEKTEDRINLLVTVHYVEPDEYGVDQEEFVYVRDLIEGEWKYTAFPFFW